MQNRHRPECLVWAASGRRRFKDIQDYILGGEFGLAGFKGQRLTFRRWNGQLRQPILLATPKAMVSVSPQKGYLHPRSYLDTLGYDEPESKCRR